MDYKYRQVPQCAICKRPANHLCGGCKMVYYCCRSHQKLGWREGHKVKCCSFKIEVSDKYGRYMVATRDIKQGEMILKEKPALMAPRISTPPICLGCHKKLLPTVVKNLKVDYYKCSSCRWPLCDAECEKSELHRSECELMTKRKYKCGISYEGKEKNEAAYCVIAPLRVLLMRDTNPLQYDNIINLESHLEERINTPLYMTLKANLLTFIIHVLGLDDFEDDTIMSVTSIFDTNAFDVRCTDSKRVRAIYVTASMMAHSCRPNTKHVFIGDEHYLAVIATVPIAKGEMITVTYTQTLWDTMERRKQLSISKCFHCECIRCQDPTECGSYVGSFYCSVCNPLSIDDPKNAAKMVSTSPLSDIAPWHCTRCDHMLTGKQVQTGNEAIRKEMKNLNKNNPKSLEQFMDKYKFTLPPTNTHMLQVKYALLQLYSESNELYLKELSEDYLVKKLQLCKDLLETADIVEPGLSKLRGILLQEAQAIYTLRTKKLLTSSKISKSLAQSKFVDYLKMVQEVAEIQKYDPEQNETLDKSIEELTTLIESLSPEEEKAETESDTIEIFEARQL